MIPQLKSPDHLRFSFGERDQGVVAGNCSNKYETRNVVVRYLMREFTRSLLFMVSRTNAKSVHDVGCGEGFWSIQLARQGLSCKGSDVSAAAIDLARINAKIIGVGVPFAVRSIYDLTPSTDRAELVVCCEVLEHLADPDKAIDALANIAAPYLIASVPREPLWRGINFLRGKYLSKFGNTPGHFQHWSRTSFVKMLAARFEIVDIRTPWPWTMVLARATT